MSETSKIPFIFSILALSFPCICYSLNNENGSEIKGMFVFGSSLVDNGNNKFLNTVVQANYLPYGIDFPNGPTGRFTNGKNVIDILCEKLRLPLIPPFSDPSNNGSKIIHGVNFASGGCGILNDTGSNSGLGGVMSLDEQIKNFEKITVPQLSIIAGNNSKELLKNYLFMVGIGGNDYTANYFVNPFYANVPVEDFTFKIIKLLSEKIQKLHELGGRKFVLFSSNPLGCYPSSKTRYNNTNGCVRKLNEAAELFNFNLKSLVDSKRLLMPGSNLIFINAYKIISDIIECPKVYGFKNVSYPCWEGTGRKVCEDRNFFLFFDGVHPTEAVNIIIGNKAFESNFLTDVYPINIKKLAMNYNS